MNYPTTRQLQYIVALHHHKNFGQAAESCFVTQPTLSAAIIELEENLGILILDRRSRKKVVFTAYGLQLIDKAKKILEIMDQILITAQAEKDPLSGILRMGVIPTIAPFLLPRILDIMAENFPKITVHITENTSATLVDQLKNSELDCAILAFPYDTEDLQTHIFFKEQFLCAAPQGIFADNQPVTYDCLRQQTLLLLDDGHCLRDHALAACQIDHVTPEKSFSASSLHTIIQMVAKGYGVTLIPQMMAQTTQLPDKISLHNFADNKPSRKIGMTYPKNHIKINDINTIVPVLAQQLS